MYFSDVISLGKGKINYRAGNEGMVSFKINSSIRIKSKSAGKDPSLWGVEVNGREGYAPKEYIKETNIFISEKDLKFVVDVVIPGTENTILSTSENVAKEEPLEDTILSTSENVANEEPLENTILSTSENVAEGEPLEITNTKPLDLIPKVSTEKPSSTPPTVVAEMESAKQATPAAFNWVDGTQIPIAEDNESLENSRSNTNDNIQKLEEDYELIDEIGDYDEEEEEEEVHQRQEVVKLDENRNPASEANVINKNLLNKNEIGNQIEQQHSEIDPTEILKDTFVSNDNTAHYQALIKSVSHELAVKNKNIHNENIQVEKNIQEEKPIFASNSTEEDIKTETHVEETTVNSLQNTTTDENININTQNKNVQAEQNTQEEKLIIPFVNEYKNETHTEESTVNSVKNENIDESKNTQKENVQVEQNTQEGNPTMLNNISKEYNKKETHIEESTVNSVINEKTDAEVKADKSENEKGILNELSKLNEELTPHDQESIYYSTTSSPQHPTEEGLNNPDTTSVENDLYKKKEITVEDIRYEEGSTTVETTFNSFVEGTTEIPPTPEINKNKETHLPSLTTEEHNKNLYEHQPIYENLDYESIGVTENPVKNFDTEDEHTTEKYANIESLHSDVSTDPIKIEEKQTKAPLSLTSPTEHLDIKENRGLFATIMGTVNNVLSINNKMKYNTNEDNTELDRILFSGKSDVNVLKSSKEGMYVLNKN